MQLIPTPHDASPKRGHDLECPVVREDFGRLVSSVESLLLDFFF
jgi:hypothetical protein